MGTYPDEEINVVNLARTTGKYGGFKAWIGTELGHFFFSMKTEWYRPQSIFFGSDMHFNLAIQWTESS